MTKKDIEALQGWWAKNMEWTHIGIGDDRYVSMNELFDMAWRYADLSERSAG